MTDTTGRRPVPEPAYLLRVAEVARLLGVSDTLVYAMCDAGEMPSVRLRRCVRVPRAALEAWLREKEAGPGAAGA